MPTDPKKYAITEIGIRFLASTNKRPVVMRNKSMYIETLTADMLQELTYGVKTKRDLVSAINPKSYARWFQIKDVHTQWAWLSRMKYLRPL